MVNRQEYYRSQYRQRNPQWRDCGVLYRQVVEREVKETTRVLDIGCGHSEFFREIYARTPHTYGIDPDAAAIERNSVIRHKTVGLADNLPYEDNFFDLVVSAWVLEHLENPKQVFQEIHRVLKPGGRCVFLTPNAWNYNTWLIRMVPNKFHGWFTSRLYRRAEVDTFPVQYKINSVRVIDKTLIPIGFKRSDIIFNGDPTYISFNSFLFNMACFIEQLFELKFLHAAKVHLIGVYQKE